MPNFARREWRRKIGLSGRRFDPFSVEQFVAEKTAQRERTVAEEADSGKAAGFAEGIRCTVAAVAELGSSVAVQILDIQCIEVEADQDQNQ